MSEDEYQAPDLLLLGEEHVRRYQETDGEVGYIWNGVPILLLTTTGRKSGQPRTTPLIHALMVTTISSWPPWAGHPNTPSGI